MKTVYAVFEQGVYRHQCGGIFETLKEARDAAKTLIMGERDDYHKFTVVPFVTGLRTSQTPLDSDNDDDDDAGLGPGRLREPPTIYRVKRCGERLIEDGEVEAPRISLLSLRGVALAGVGVLSNTLQFFTTTPGEAYALSWPTAVILTMNGHLTNLVDTHIESVALETNIRPASMLYSFLDVTLITERGTFKFRLAGELGQHIKELIKFEKVT